MPDYSKMSTEDFDRILADVMDNDNDKPSELLSLAGIYEVVSEHYNNTVLDEWAQQNPKLAYPEDYADEEDTNEGEDA